MDTEFYTPKEIAKKLKCTETTIYRYLRANKIQSVKLGNTYRITAGDFQHFLESRKSHGGETNGS